MKKLLAFIVLIILAGAAATAWVFAGTRQRYRGFSTSEQFVDIRPGTGTRAIGEQLVGAGVVRDHLTFRAALWMSGLNECATGSATTPYTAVCLLIRL